MTDSAEKREAGKRKTDTDNRQRIYGRPVSRSGNAREDG